MEGEESLLSSLDSNGGSWHEETPVGQGWSSKGLENPSSAHGGIAGTQTRMLPCG